MSPARSDRFELERLRRAWEPPAGERGGPSAPPVRPLAPELALFAELRAALVEELGEPPVHRIDPLLDQLRGLLELRTGAGGAADEEAAPPLEGKALAANTEQLGALLEQLEDVVEALHTRA